MKETATGIPDKLFFKIGEVARIADIKPHVLRYWESEFGVLQPVKSKSGQRIYRRRDVETVLQIKNLLYLQRYTIEGAKKRLKKEDSDEQQIKQLDLPFEKGKLKEAMLELKRELLAIMDMLNRTP